MERTPLVMLRVAGLPVDSVHRLRCPASARWADEVLAGEAALRARGAELSDLLHRLVGANEDDRSRRRLLALRRQVFGNVLPPDPAGAVDLVAALDADVAKDLAQWLAERSTLAAASDAGAALVAAEFARTRGELRSLAGEERLSRGLPLASPTLAGQVRLLPGAETARPDKRARRIERSIVSYLYRTACKTSPFSTFTGIGLAEDVPGAPPVELPAEWPSHARLNVVVLGRLAEAVLADPGRRGDLPVELASGWRHDDERVRYVRRWTRSGDDSASVSFDSAREHPFFLRRSGLLDRLIARFADSSGLRCGDVVRWLADEEAAPPAECERYLSTLVELGMLRVRGLETDVHADDPLRALRDSLDRLDAPWATELAARLAVPIALVDAYPAATASARRQILADLRAELTQTLVSLGAPEAALPQVLLYEDASIGDAPLRLDLDRWLRPVGDDLRTIERILPAFDPTVAHRITFKGFFLARYGVGGRCDDILKLISDFHEDFYEQYATYTAGRRPLELDESGEYVPEENWMALPAITALDDARRRFVAHLRALRATGAPPAPDAPGSEAAEIRLDRRVLQEMARLLAPLGRDVVAHSHFLQLVARDRDPVVVLNQTYGGLSFAFSRFTHCFAGLPDRLRRLNQAVQPDGVVFAELTGGAATTNLNLHGRLTDHEIVSPGEQSCAPPERQIPLADLYLEHDAGRDHLALRSHRLGCEVVPLYFGYLMPAALPEVPRTLLLLSPTSMGRLDVWGGGPGVDGGRPVTERPRVRLGGVVLGRRSWHVRAGDLPPLAAGPPGPTGAGDHEWYLAWRRWWHAHGLPRQVFATVHQVGENAGPPPKPQYVDVDSLLSLTAFTGLVRSAEDQVVIREMLPTADDLHARSGRGAHVAELVVQTIGGSDER